MARLELERGTDVLLLETGDALLLELSSPETLRPSAEGDSVQFTIAGSSPAATNWESVDERIADEDITYLYTTSAVEHDLYELPAHSGSGVINGVTVYMRVKNVGESSPYAAEKIKTHETEYERPYPGVQPGTSYTNYSYEWEDNPNTSSPWTWDEIDALQAGLAMGAEDEVGSMRCTQVYVEVDFAPEGEATVGVGITPSALRSLKLARESSAEVGVEATADRQCVFHRYGWRP